MEEKWLMTRTEDVVGRNVGVNVQHELNLTRRARDHCFATLSPLASQHQNNDRICFGIISNIGHPDKFAPFFKVLINKISRPQTYTSVTESR